MHICNILAIARKDALDILLNKTTLYFLLSPIAIAILFAIVGTLLTNKTASASLLIYNPGNSPVEQAVSKAFDSAPIVHVSSPEDVANAFGPQGSHKNTSYILGLVIPANLEDSLRDGEHPEIILYVNGADLDASGTLLVEHTLTDYARSVTSPQAPIDVSVTSINPPTNTFVQDYTSRYAMAGLLYSLTIGIGFILSLLVEEKEKKTMRMLMVSPASWGDVVAGKLLVGLGYQLLISAIVLLIQNGFTGQIPLLLVLILLGSSLGIVLGLLFGSICQTNGTVGMFVSIIGLIYTLPSLVLGPLYSVVQGSPFEQVVKILPTYYIADGFLKAMQNQASPGNILLDAGIQFICIAVFFVAAIWALRHQAATVGAI